MIRIDWVSSDNSIEKYVKSAGEWAANKPYLNSKCIFELIDIDSVVSKESKHLRTELKSVRQELRIGEAETALDRTLEKCLQTMQKYEVSRFRVTPEQTQFEVSLIDFEFDGYVNDWSYEKKYDLALKFKNKGMELKKDDQYAEASQHFSLAFKMLSCCEPLVNECKSGSVSDPEQLELRSRIVFLKHKVVNALAWTNWRHCNWEAVIGLTDESLQLVDETSGGNVAAVKLRGLAYARVKEYEKAIEDFNFVLKSRPNDKQVLAALKKTRADLATYHEQYALMSKKMLNII